jgi:hypothetical protein
MDDSLFGTTNMGPALSNWQSLEPNVMRNTESDNAMRGNLTTISQSEIVHVSCCVFAVRPFLCVKSNLAFFIDKAIPTWKSGFWFSTNII